MIIQNLTLILLQIHVPSSLKHIKFSTGSKLHKRIIWKRLIYNLWTPINKNMGSLKTENKGKSLGFREGDIKVYHGYFKVILVFGRDAKLLDFDGKG